MGDFFPERQEEIPKSDAVAEKIIDNFREMVAAYDEQTNAIVQTSQNYEMIVAGRAKLLGQRRTMSDTGMVGRAVQFVNTSRLYNIPEGRNIASALEEAEHLILWFDRYSEYLEKFLKASRTITRSAFLLINRMTADMEKLRQENAMLRDRVVESPRYTPDTSMPPEVLDALREKKVERARLAKEARLTKQKDDDLKGPA